MPSATTRSLLLTDTPIDLDKHRGMAAQKATDLRRVLAEVEANSKLLRQRQTELEAQLLALPAGSWPDAAAKARYLLTLYQDKLDARDTQHRCLIEAVLADFTRLSGES